MNKLTIIKFIAGFTFLVGVAVMLGWYFDINALTSVVPGLATMKFTTAICFSLSGVMLFFMARVFEGELDVSHIALSLTAFIILLIMSVLFFSVFFEIHTGIEDLFVVQAKESIFTVPQGQPSMGTIFNFILIGIGSILVIYDPQWCRKKLFLLGGLIAVVSLTAVVGYMINVPYLYYEADGISNAMAIHTAILFALQGSGFMLLAKD